MHLPLCAIVCLFYSPLATIIASPLNASPLIPNNDNSTNRTPLNTTSLNETIHINFFALGFSTEGLVDTNAGAIEGFDAKYTLTTILLKLEQYCPSESPIVPGGKYDFYQANVGVHIVVSAVHGPQWTCNQLGNYLQILRHHLDQDPYNNLRNLHLLVRFTPPGMSESVGFAKLGIYADAREPLSTPTDFGVMEVYVTDDRLGASNIDATFRDVQRRLTYLPDRPPPFTLRSDVGGVIFEFEALGLLQKDIATSRRVLELMERGLEMARSRPGAREKGFSVKIEENEEFRVGDALFWFAPTPTLVRATTGDIAAANISSVSLGNGTVLGPDTFA